MTEITIYMALYHFCVSFTKYGAIFTDSGCLLGEIVDTTEKYQSIASRIRDEVAQQYDIDAKSITIINLSKLN